MTMDWAGVAGVVCAEAMRLARKRQANAVTERTRTREAERMSELYSLRRDLRYRFNNGM